VAAVPSPGPVTTGPGQQSSIDSYHRTHDGGKNSWFFKQVFALSIDHLQLCLTVQPSRAVELRRWAPCRSLAWLGRRGLGSCALPTRRELPFVYNWGVLRTPLFYLIKSLCN